MLNKKNFILINQCIIKKYFLKILNYTMFLTHFDVEFCSYIIFIFFSKLLRKGIILSFHIHNFKHKIWPSIMLPQKKYNNLQWNFYVNHNSATSKLCVRAGFARKIKGSVLCYCGAVLSFFWQRRACPCFILAICVCFMSGSIICS